MVHLKIHSFFHSFIHSFIQYILLVFKSMECKKMDGVNNIIFYFYFCCYTVHVVKSLSYFTNHCTYINL